MAGNKKGSTPCNGQSSYSSSAIALYEFSRSSAVVILKSTLALSATSPSLPICRMGNTLQPQPQPHAKVPVPRSRNKPQLTYRNYTASLLNRICPAIEVALSKKTKQNVLFLHIIKYYHGAVVSATVFDLVLSPPVVCRLPRLVFEHCFSALS